MIITPREKDLGGFSVRRILPYHARRMVGPFIFLDHMGPADLAPEKGMDVRPHPHIGLATVTYLYSGTIQHKDSLGSDQRIEPGAINWMIAGRGIVHSERTPPDIRPQGTHMNGLQCWVALPEAHEETEPLFQHHAATALPEFEINSVRGKILLGAALGLTSPVKVHSPIFYIDVQMPAGSRFEFPYDHEAAAYVVSGEARIQGQTINSYSMAVGEDASVLMIDAVKDSRLMILGGAPVGERFIFWNFVASSQEKLDAAKTLWKNGPQKGTRFSIVPLDEKEFIPLPAD